MMTLDDLVPIRRDLYAHPELAFDETRTASVVAARLRALGLTVREQVGRTGVVADHGRQGAGPNLVLRAEMDALPVSEPEGGGFRSTIPGVMHACGHDAHMAILLGVAAELSRRSESFPGLTRFVFQPAEEIGAGAQAMLDDGALDGRSWDAILAVHLRPFLPVGEIGICRGSATAKVGEFQVDVRGTGGHGGRPHVSTDALLAAVEIVAALQTLIPREVSAFDQAVLSVCSIHAGSAANVMPAQATFEGTVRAASDEVYEQLFARIADVSVGIGEAFRCAVESRRRDTMPPVRSGCYVFVGSAPTDGRPATPNHGPSWDFDERALEIGARVLLGTIDRLVEAA